jgi:hypothetical protein
MNGHGRPVLAAFAGFFFFLSIGVLLLTFGVVALDSILLIILPIVGIILGVAWAVWAPLGRRRTAH